MKLPKSLRLPKRPRIYLRRIVGDSMLPAMRSGTLVVFVASNKLRVGDVVMFKHQKLEKIKRIARIESTRVYVLGDNSSASTDSRSFGWIDRKQIAGRLPRRARRQTIQ